ncbi:PP2C family protein-serine/threonine phosphatase [Flavisolibacter ginsengisoli]|jgi:serine/threonine protein phosphatase PrpC|uniref:Serine/threonine protein phosphatase PrpC n=1 Tax=Flavisolibacter ginsengisoli DSM 18119 TaxID=1121884 RepID=A0A1M4U5Q6_9BACT|nr:PP2C family serine/threonine-protein phosphatase [Flavisolibacter ginsengisoli]SHE52151.1 Serine/threonine protein phosphatase PrpC [Flavisolibacter ginsengisoli DSM 18119]
MADNFFGLTDTGRIRDNNEDAFVARQVFNKQWILASVIDGVGGYEGGEVAAEITKEEFLNSFTTLPSDPIRKMKEAIISSNERIYKEKLESGKNSSMACVVTLALVDVKNNKFYYAHVGDTRLYLYRDHSLIKVTRDQSFVGYLEDSGRISEEEAMRHPKRNEINKALGFDNQSILAEDYIETGESPFLPGDALLICSDGLSDMISSARISQVLEKKSSLEQKAAELIEAANEAGGKDNITVVLVQNNKKPLKQPASKPVLVKKKKVEPVISRNDMDESVEPVATTKHQTVASQVSNPGKRHNNILWILSILCLLFLSGFIWMWWSKNHFSGTPGEVVKKEKNVQEIRLQTFINASPGDTVELETGSKDHILYLTDTLWVNRPSLYLKGKNTILLRDSSSSNRVAIMVSPECRSLVIDSLTIDGFDIGISMTGKESLQLKGVKFKNCPINVAFRFSGTGDLKTVFRNATLSKDTTAQNSIH